MGSKFDAQKQLCSTLSKLEILYVLGIESYESTFMEFKQSRWLKPYIEFDTKKRQEAKNAFEKDLFKLMNNSIYGKTLQSNRHHLDVRIVKTEKESRNSSHAKPSRASTSSMKMLPLQNSQRQKLFWTNRSMLECIFLTYLNCTCVISTTTISCLCTVRGPSCCFLTLIV